MEFFTYFLYTLAMNIALITGASSGIGKEFVKQLASNQEIDEFWLIARRKEKMLELQECTSKKIVPLSLDLSLDESYKEIESRLKQYKPNISYLICAAGLGKVGAIKDNSFDDIQNMLKINVESSVKVTRLALDYMHEDSHILEIGSIAGFQPMPYFGIYGASKAFLQSYTKSLHEELKHTGIKVTLVCPYWVKDTEFISKAKVKGVRYSHYPLATTKDKVVKKALRASEKNRIVCTPDAVSSIDRVFSKVLPNCLYVKIMNFVSKM